ncbi:SLC13 family permease [Megasphaera vaginalis (ex Srinivasan et al. 2021)]|uniref:Dicarboxylate carrier protein MatC N-terminal domain protein n=1 Tax=Megasphaera vaginalis (ex Srinivasan et al. 2021) TaxID=1111454 RepID=U7UHS2_9FIRM|nr:SLC13 family permease [Megasphaera vaginalis (ex Srinivasan et al. 2021)]ERT57998.1 dicarboxylate carrier protein MatC N-terminal domain protein [Megasphaera vaginalis (ex Srinivasan et al. 2021)]
MGMDALSFILFVFAIIIAFIRHVNVGLVAIAVGAVCVRLFGMPDKVLIGGISSGMFCTLVGITFLFSVIKSTGALDLLAKKIVASTRGHIWMLPIAMYIAGFIVAGIGPGAVPALAIIPALAVSTAIQVGYNPVMMGLIGVFGLMAGRMTPITPEAAIITGAASSAGIENVMPTILVCKTLITIIFGVIVFLVYKGYTVKSTTVAVEENELPPFTKHQIIALSGIVLMLMLIVFGNVNIGLAAFFSAVLLVLGGIAKDGECLKELPWGTIMMVLCVGALLSVVDKVGGIKLMSDGIASFMNSTTAVPLISISAGLLSLVSSALGVVYPTMMPMCADIAVRVGGVDPVALMAAVGAGGSLAGLSPMSTGGALILAALGTNVKDFNSTKQSKVFIELIIWAGVGLLLIAGVSLIAFSTIAAIMR